MRKRLIGALTGWVFFTLSFLAFAAFSAEIKTQLLVYRVTEPGE